MDQKKLRKNDPVVITGEGPYKGHMAYYISPYPYPEGDPLNPKSMLEIATPNLADKKQKILLHDNEFVAVVNHAADKQFMDVYKDRAAPCQIRSPKFAEGDRVIIKYGEHRGDITVVRAVHEVAGGRLFDCECGPFPASLTSNVQVNLRIPEEYLESWGSVDPPMMVEGFDVSRYLGLDTMKVIAENVYTQTVKEYVDEIVKHRSGFGGTSLTDWCLGHALGDYVDVLMPEVKEDVLDRIRDVVKGKAQIPDNDLSFNAMLTNTLSMAASKYVEDHKDQLSTLFEEACRESAKQLGTDEIIRIISRNIDVKGLIQKAFEKKDGE